MPEHHDEELKDMSFQYRPCRGIVDDDKVRKNHLTLPSPRRGFRSGEIVVVFVAFCC
jgi:hypothetical protein